MAQVNSRIDQKEELLWRADAAARQAELVPPEEREPWLSMAERCRDLAHRIQAQERRASAH
jgi:hypothetical protein